MIVKPLKRGELHDIMAQSNSRSLDAAGSRSAFRGATPGKP